MLILGIETSCDETACAVVQIKNSQPLVRSNIISSQVKLHAKYGGVYPTLAAREHVKNISHVLRESLQKANVKMKDIDLIAATKGPGLAPALLIGLTFGKVLAWKHEKPFVGVNHMEGHVYSNWLTPVENQISKIKNQKFLLLNNKSAFPALNLIVSGGHTELVLMKSHRKYEMLGSTRDDAAGEAFDKIARLLKLGYPGGKAISEEADKFKNKRQELRIKLPRPMIDSKDLDFSFSGLKTAVLYLIRDITKNGRKKLPKKLIPEICHESQNAIVDVLISKTKKAANKYKIKSIMLSGGVSANKTLRARMGKLAENLGVPYFQPDMSYTTDNAAMIALAGYMNRKLNIKDGKVNINRIDIEPNLKIAKISVRK